jgi:hypothetical protein
MRLHVVLGVIFLAVLGALLHPLAVLLAILPLDTRRLLGFLAATKSLIADLLAWGLVGLLVVMLVLIAVGRLRRQLPETKVRTPIPSGGRLSIAVGIIAYNEAEAIANVVRDFKAQEGVIDVVVVDNNSRDATAQLARAAGARVIRETRQGYGYACIRALQEASAGSQADAVVLTEGDSTFSGTDLAKFQAYIRQADMIMGTRVVPGLVEDGSQMDYFFTWGNIAVGTLLRLRFWHSQFLGAARLSDVGCTYRMINVAALRTILPDLVVGGHHFSPHMMLVALSRGLSVVEIPITFRRRTGTSKGASRSLWKGLAVGMAMVWHISTYRPNGARVTAPEPAEGALQVGKT